MSQLSIFKSIFCILLLAALAISCINVNIPGQATSSTPPAGNVVTTPEPPTIESFTASPENLLSGRSGTLSWSVKNADSIMITPELGNVAASGSKTVKPANETTYTLVASNTAGMAAVPVTIKILTVSNLEVGLPGFEKAGSGAQRGGSGNTVVGSLGSDLQSTNRADLSIIAGDISTHKGVHAAFQIKNLGSANSNPMDAVLKIDGSVKSSYHIAEIMHAGDVTTAKFDYNLTPDPNAVHNIEILIDVNNTNMEQNENNNSLKFTAPYY